MHFLFLIFCYLFSVFNLSAEALPYLTSENDALSLVEGIVNIYNGKLVQKNLDIQILGSKPFEINRYYDSGHHFTSKLGYGVGLSTPLLLKFNKKEKKRNLTFEQRTGFEIACTIKKVSGKKKDAYYSGAVDKKIFKSGYTNCSEALLNGEPSLQALKVEGDYDTFIVKFGNGTLRHYSFFTTEYKTRCYRLVREDFPDTTHRHYSYKNEHSLLLKKIWTTNFDNSLTFNFVNFHYGNTHLYLTTSNGLYVCYHKKLEEGEIKRSKAFYADSDDARETILEKVTSNYLPECNYTVSTHARDKDTLFTLKEIEHPNGLSLKADYNKRKRVKRLWKSGVKVPLYSFKYYDDCNIVKDANGRSKRFYYDHRRLVATVEEEQTSRFTWDDKGQLIKQKLTDSKNHTIIQKEYAYDLAGNIIKAKVKGTICQKDSQDEDVVSYTYGDSCNRLLRENHNHKKEITYVYVKETNLLEKKLTFADDAFVEREFYQYDPNGILIQKIIDDGNSSEKDDLTNVSYRLITDIEPQLNPSLPGMTFPRLIKESYIDLKRGEKKLLKMVENIYCYGDLLSEEKTYDANGNYCYSRFFEYDKRRLSSETDAMGNKTIYHYDENGNKTDEEKIGTGRKLQFVYDKANNLIHEIEHTDIALVQSYTYDAVGNRIRVKDCFGQTTTYQYDSQNREISSTDPLKFTTKKEYDVQGHLIKQIDQDGYVTHTTYNILGKPLEIIYPDGSFKRFLYNLQGHLIQEWERDGLSTTYEVDYKGRSQFTKTFAPNGSLLKETSAIYKGNNLNREIDAMGSLTQYSYDGAGRVVTKVQEDQTTYYEYDALGNLFKKTSPDSVEIKLYDFLNRIIEERTEDLNGNIYRKNEFGFDIQGNQILEKTYQDAAHYSETKTLFNSRNLPIQTLDALGNDYKITYHYRDHLEKETIDPLSRKTLEIFDILNRLSALQKFSSEGELLSQSSFAYDGRGNKTFEIHKVLAQNQHYSDFFLETSFDAFSQKILEKEQADKITSYTYQNGRLHQIIQPNGIVVNHTYDALGRLFELTSSDNTIHYRYTYDLNDNLLKSEDLIQNIATELYYDSLNRLIKEKQATGFEICYSYDTLNRLIEVQFQDEKITYSYSPISVVSASRYKNNHLLYTFTQETDWTGNTIHQILPGSLNISCSWDDLGRCLNLSSNYFQQSFAYDAVNNLISTSVKDPTSAYQSTFSYDNLNQLTQESGFFNNQYLFDSLNNRRSINQKTYAVNALNQMTSDSEENYTYDKNGNRLSKGNTQYTYDALNRLSSISTDDKTTHYTYDSFGRRIEERSANKTIHYLYQFDTEIASLSNNKILEFKALYDAFSPFAIELENKIYTPIRNHRGDICVLIDTEENIVSTYRYDAFGQFSYNGSIKSPWLFSSQRYDENSNLYHFLNRDYDPATGRWLTPDPLGFADGPNLYAYVHNNPLIYVDPYGLSEMSLYQGTKTRMAEFFYSPRFQGACQMFSGCAEMCAGGAITYGTGGFAAPVGFSAIAHGADHFSTGLSSFITGRYHETATSQALQKAGVSQNIANLADNTLSTVFTMGGAAVTRTFQKTATQNYKLPPNSSGSDFLVKKCLDNKKQIWSNTKSKTSVENALQHWNKHGKEFSEVQNAKQYVEKAWNNLKVPSNSVLSKTRPNGEMLFYHQENNIFFAYTKNGVPKTMFRPTKGINYWENQ